MKKCLSWLLISFVCWWNAKDTDGHEKNYNVKLNCLGAPIFCNAVWKIHFFLGILFPCPMLGTRNNISFLNKRVKYLFFNLYGSWTIWKTCIVKICQFDINKTTFFSKCNGCIVKGYTGISGHDKNNLKHIQFEIFNCREQFFLDARITWNLNTDLMIFSPLNAELHFRGNVLFSSSEEC